MAEEVEVEAEESGSREKRSRSQRDFFLNRFVSSFF